MRYLSFAQPERSSYPIVLLVPALRKDEIHRAYVGPYGLNQDEVLAIEQHAGPNNKLPMAERKAWIQEELVPALTQISAQYLVVTDSDYFKALTKAQKVEASLGYVLDCTFGPWKVVYVPSFKAIFYDPDKVKAKIARGMNALVAHRFGEYQDPGQGIIHHAAYPQTPELIEQWLLRLLEEPVLAADIEAFSLKHTDSGIGTISFAWNQHEGIAFPVDYWTGEQLGDNDYAHASFIHSPLVRRMLRAFFEQYQGKLMWHGISYDVYILIAQLFMDHVLDQKGLLYGLEVMLRHWDCTKLITYLATNSCAGNKLGLKVQAQEFAGDYAKDEINDIRRIPLPELLQYNLVDSLSTWFTWNKHWSTLVADQQLEIYQTLFQPAIVDIIQMQLTGLPIDMPRVLEVEQLLQADYQAALQTIQASTIALAYTYRLNTQWVEKKNATLKKKRVTLADAKEVFNPNSGPQLQDLLFNMLGLPVVGYTDSKQPSTDKDAIKALLNHTEDPYILDFLKALQDHNAVVTILTSFIPAMKKAAPGPDGWHYLFGNFNLGGTVSGRLSSSKPNLQNIPANGTKYAKVIKSCFRAPPGWLFCGLDFASLEDKISGLTTKDPMKLKVYTDGYDGHSLRAYGYFGQDMPLIKQSNGRRVFKITQGEEILTLFEGDQVTLSNGDTLRIEELITH